EIVGMSAIVKDIPANRRAVALPRQLIAGHDGVRRRLPRPQCWPHIADEEPNAHAEPAEDDDQAEKAWRHGRQGVGNRDVGFSVSRGRKDANVEVASGLTTFRAGAWRVFWT